MSGRSNFESESHPASSTTERLSRYLPFAIDDFANVNDCYSECVETGHPEHWRTLDIWTYCFVRRYFTIKCLKDPAAKSSDLDFLIESAFVRIRRSRDSLRTDRYANWVSVLCRNTYLNYRRSRKPTYSLDDPSAGFVAVAGGQIPTGIAGDRLGFLAENVVAEPDPASERDSLAAVEAVSAAIDRLPGYLRDVARLKLLDGLNYDQIASEVDRPAPVLRSYFHRALLRLRKDRSLIDFFYGESPPGPDL